MATVVEETTSQVNLAPQLSIDADKTPVDNGDEVDISQSALIDAKQRKKLDKLVGESPLI